MDERQSFLQDDDEDRVLFEKLQEHVLDKYPNPQRIGCIDHSLLETWVYSPEKLDLSDPQYLHVLKCAECTRELIELRNKRNAQRTQLGVLQPQRSAKTSDRRWVGIAAILLCALTLTAAGIGYWRYHASTLMSQTLQNTPTVQTIDLSGAGTTRGNETSTVTPVALPRSVVTTHILLPYFSPGGKYSISVTMDRNGSPARAEGQGIASVNGFHADLTVTLDLRNLPEGTYYLATTHEGDRASYYYPLTVH